MDEQQSWRLLRRLRWALRPVLVILLARNSMARQLFRKQSEAAGATFDRLGPFYSARRSLLDRDFAPVDRAMGSYLGGCRFVGGCVALA